jgi:hypothetical protein
MNISVGIEEGDPYEVCLEMGLKCKKEPEGVLPSD